MPGLTQRLIVLVLIIVDFGQPCLAQSSADDSLFHVEVGALTVRPEYTGDIAPPVLSEDIGNFASRVQNAIAYPKCAKEYKVSGAVTLSFKVDKNGDVRNIRVFKRVSECLDEAALQCLSILKELKFKTPPTIHGQHASATMLLPVVFRVEGMEIGSCVHTYACSLGNEGLKELSAGNLESAIDLLTKSIEADSTVATFNGRGKANMQSGRFSEAISDFTLAIEHTNDPTKRLYIERAEARMKTEDVLGAKEDYSMRLSIDPSDVRALIGRGKASLLLGDDVQGAKSDFQKAADKSPNNHEPRYFLALLCYQESDFEMATTHLDKVIELNPNLSSGFYYRGMAKARQRKMTEACEDWVIAKSLGNTEVLNVVEANCTK